MFVFNPTICGRKKKKAGSLIKSNASILKTAAVKNKKVKEILQK